MAGRTTIAAALESSVPGGTRLKVAPARTQRGATRRRSVRLGESSGWRGPCLLIGWRDPARASAPSVGVGTGLVVGLIGQEGCPFGVAEVALDHLAQPLLERVGVVAPEDGVPEADGAVLAGAGELVAARAEGDG